MKKYIFIFVILPSILFAQNSNIPKPEVAFSKKEYAYFDAGSLIWNDSLNKWVCIYSDNDVVEKVYKMHQNRSVKKNKLLFTVSKNYDTSNFDLSILNIPENIKQNYWKTHFHNHNTYFIENAQKSTFNNNNLNLLLDSLHIKKWIVFGKQEKLQLIVKILLSKGYEVNLVEDIFINDSSNTQNNIDLFKEKGVQLIKSDDLFHYYTNY